MNQGEIWIVDLEREPVVGHEMQKKRPGLIVSPDELNKPLGTVIIAPITSTNHQSPFLPDIEVGTVKGKISLAQMRVVDKTRLTNKVAELTDIELKSVLGILQSMFA
jgi:mRNA interferase MazF